MPENTILTRAQVPFDATWNSQSVFASRADWQVEFDQLTQDISTLAAYRNRLSTSPQILLEALKARDELARRTQRVGLYANLYYAVDTNDQTAAGMSGRSQGLYARLAAATSFIDPELLVIGLPTLLEWQASEPALQEYAHTIDNLFRQQAHVRSSEVEELLGMLGEPFGAVRNVANVLTNGEIKFTPAVDSAGNTHPLTQGNLMDILAWPDRAARQSAWRNYHDAHLAFQNTLAANLSASMRANVFEMRARRFNSSLEASLFRNNIPVEVFHNLLDTFQANLPTWHRYWELRRKTLGVEKLEPYDVWAPLKNQPVTVTYHQAVELICQGLAPMGAEYVARVRRGCLEERWVDWYPNLGKRSGAFSSGAPGTYPFIVMSYNDNLFSLSTLAHELGHSMHSALSYQSQPLNCARYTLFAAEVASNFHQALVRAHLLKTQADASFQLGVIEEAMSNFHRYFLIMPTLARWELEMHQRVEKGQSLTASVMIERLADLFAEAYGPAFTIDRPRLGIGWATYVHMYMDYYVYQYATGISGAHALAQRVLAEGQPAVERYLGFLKAGGSLYPLQALKLAGVDLTTPAPVEATFAVMSGYVDQLENLV